MRRVFYNSPFIPHEWISAFDYFPCHFYEKIQTVNIRQRAPMGACPFAFIYSKSLAMMTREDVAVFDTACDQMRRMSEKAALDCAGKIFLFNIPSTWQSETSKNIYRSELIRLGEFLEKCGGKDFNPAKIIKALKRDEKNRICVEGKSENKAKIPVAIIGENILPRFRTLYKLIKKNGGQVVFDMTKRSPEIAPSGAPLEAAPRDEWAGFFADAYFEKCVGIFQRPNSKFYDTVAHNIEESGARGVIVMSYLWCDLWRAEILSMQRRFGIPLLFLELGDSASMDSGAQNRIDSFFETLR